MFASKKFGRYLAWLIFPAISACGAIGPVTVGQQSAIQQKLDKPGVCVSLSGGGLRSASFSTGILRGLKHQGVLDQIDVVSATSGGGWASLWFQARLAEGASLDDIYGMPGTDDTKMLRGLERTSFVDSAWTAWTGITAPIRVAGSAYYAAIASKFGRTSLFADTSIEDINKNVLAHKVPVPIITVASFAPCLSPPDGRFGAKGPKLEHRLKELMPMSKHLIELTPQGWGSAEQGRSMTFPFELREMEYWVRVSSAAIDAPGYEQCKLLRVLGGTFGEHVTSPKTIGLEWNQQHDIFVADGGFVDNLAVRNVVERGCKSILISDAEHDPGLVFEAYRRLNADLALSGHKLVITQIDDWLQKSAQLEKAGKVSAQASGEPPAIDDKPVFRADDPANEIVKQPVLEGCITKGQDCDSAADRVSRVLYIKLSINPAQVSAGAFNPHVKRFYDKSLAAAQTCEKGRGQGDDCSFPQTPTLKTDYSADEFRAYRLLAEDLVRMNGVGAKLTRPSKDESGGSPF